MHTLTYFTPYYVVLGTGHFLTPCMKLFNFSCGVDDSKTVVLKYPMHARWDLGQVISKEFVNILSFSRRWSTIPKQCGRAFC